MPETGGGLLGRARSVRLRITLAAAVVTAVAVALAGWLMIRSVESTRLGQVRADDVADLLRRGVPPEKAVGQAACGPDLAGVVVFDESGTPLASNPNLLVN